MTNTRTYRATREITLEFPDQKCGAKYLTINDGHVLTGEVADGFLYFFTGFGPARIPLVLLEPVANQSQPGQPE